MFLLQLLSFGTYFMQVYDGPSEGPSPHIEPRINIVLTLLLTVVAFKVSIAEQLPKVAKFTQIDRYLVWSFFTLTAIALEIFLLDDIADRFDWNRTTCDSTAFTTMFVLWIVLQLKFAQRFYKAANDKATFDEKADKPKSLAPLSEAAQHGHVEAARLLLEGAAADDQSKAAALRLAKGKQMKALLREHGARLTLPEECASVRPPTPLQRWCSGWCAWCSATACLDGNVAVVAQLLDDGADVEATDDSGTTPLSAAAASGQLEVTRLLLDRGAKVKKADGKSGAAALSEAAAHGHVEVARLLLDRGATADGKSGAPNAAALRLAKGKKMKALLRERGARLTLPEECRDGNLAAIRMLLNVNSGAGGKPLSATELGGQLAALDDEASRSDRSLSGESGRLNRALSGESGRAT